ncbi:hypothetical protein P2T68_27115 [Pseudomonas sp. G11]|uniref:hypothetical protein n=1 Tax=Pseudomonas sp. G11 TaxID=528343 RepID=UPI00240275B9|nr:hypothetical protein [Pseudomonas sp. G11]WEX14256.1 hypothetical protein P2T68_27115 [Pseudomonas sp. G11]
MNYFTQNTDLNSSEESGEDLTCIECGCYFSVTGFEFVDAELDEVECRCPHCQLSHDVLGHPCDYCEEPAVHSVGSTFYCEEHFEDLVGD